MGGRELDEQPTQVEQQTESSGLSTHFLERNETTLQVADKNKRDIADLVAKEALPAFELDEVLAGPLNRNELRAEGIKCRRDSDGNTEVNFPNGVSVRISEGGTKTLPSGRQVELGPSHIIAVPPELEPTREKPPAGSGIMLDKNGNQIAKVNKDGSVTVATSASDFYTVSPDGHVVKDVAVRSRDGKSWTMIPNPMYPLIDPRLE
jgi:hypothetical protein